MDTNENAKKSRLDTKCIALIGLMAAVTCILGLAFHSASNQSRANLVDKFCNLSGNLCIRNQKRNT